jgi:hypothetical protein
MLQAVAWIKTQIKYVIWMNLTPTELKLKETMMSHLKNATYTECINVCESIIDEKLKNVDHQNMIDWIKKNPNPTISKKPPIKA